MPTALAAKRSPDDLAPPVTGALLTPMPGCDAALDHADAGRAREALLAAMRELAAEHGWRRVSVDALCARAGVARAAFGEHFDSIEACFAAAVDEALERLLAEVSRALAEHEGSWAERTAAAIGRLFRVLDADPVLAWLCVVEPLNGNPAARRARQAAGARLAELLADPASAQAAEVAHPAVTGALWGMVEQHLLDPDGMSFEESVSSAIYLVVAPVAGPIDALAIARRTIAADARPRARRKRAPRPAPEIRSRDMLALVHLRDHPRASNREIAAAIGDRHESQVSRRLAALERRGLVRRGRSGRHNAWELTREGEAMVADVQLEGG
jgi:AcrR family transcriptional regulator